MSLLLDNKEHELDVKELLEIIAQQLILLNARVEEGYKTTITLRDALEGMKL